MGLAMEILSGKATNPSTIFTAWTMATGDSLTVRNIPPGTNAWLVDAWALGATKGILRVRSPRMHDNVQGIRMPYAASTPVPLLTGWENELLQNTDTLTVDMTGGGAETDCGSLLVYYDNLPGADARLATWQEIAPRVRHIMGVEVDITTGGTAGDYGGGTAINATFDQFKADQDYAVLGYVTDTAVASIGMRGPDFGNLRLGGPGTNNKIETRDWFVRLGTFLGRPTIPIIKANNKAGTIVDALHTATGTAIVVSFLCAQLG